MNREDVKNCLKHTISNMTLEEFSRLFINEVIAIEEFYKLCNNKKAGNTISLLFNPHRLNIITEASVTRTSAPMSIYQSLSDKGNELYTEKIDGMARLFLYNLESEINNPFYCTIQRGYNGVAYVNEFPPYVARQLYYKYTKSKKSRIILDPCAGWGGRMIGAASLANSRYVACEPSVETYNGLVKLGNWLKCLQPSFDFEIHNIPYEEFVTEEVFDIAVTSPPYFNTEHYSVDDTDSAIRYPEYNLWVNNFYTPLIVNTINRLSDNGVFILNIGDRKYPLSDSMKNICEQNSFHYERESNYLSTNNENGEKFFCIRKNLDFAPKVSNIVVKSLW